MADRKPEDYENALKAVVGITMDTLRGESPFEPPPDPESHLRHEPLLEVHERLPVRVRPDHDLRLGVVPP